MDLWAVFVLLAYSLLHTSIATYHYPYSYYHCEFPGTPDNGYIQGGSMAINSTLQFGCNEDFILYGAKTITCHQGTFKPYWNEDPPLCIPINPERTGKSRTPKCGKTPKPGHHAILLSSINKTILKFECEDPSKYIEESGDKVVYCHKKKWQGKPLRCRRRSTCNQQVASEHVIHKTSGYKEEDVALFSCEEGYMLLGESYITCLRTGEWSSTWPSCIQNAIPCPYPSGISYGQVGMTTTSKARYRCNTGYILVGNKTVNCGINGQWTPAPPSCVPVNCGELSGPANGYVRHSVTTYNAFAYYHCNTGYDLSGPYHRRCGSNGEWSGEEPTCEPKQCPVPTVPNYGQVYAPTQTVGGVATYSCNEGYNLYGVSTRECLTSAVWSGTPPSCLPVNCGSLTDPVDGKVHAKLTTFEAVATYNCKRGHVLIGDITRTCQANGLWSGSQPKCVSPSSVTCDSLSSPEHGNVQVSYTGVRPIAKYSCDRGYQLSGPEKRECMVNGQWSKYSPLCQAVDCGDPPSVPKGLASTASTTFTSLATYSCNEGYTLVGESNTLRCNAYGKWEGQLPRCAAINCGDPPSIPNGQATFSSTNFTSVATYVCQKGYTLEKNGSTVICQANGQWKGPPPTCVEIDCGKPPTIENGSPSFTTTNFLSQVSYSCDEGYVLIGGNSPLSCQANRQWMGEIPSCIATECGNPPSITNGQVSFSSTTFTAEAMYSCDQGYSLIGDSTLLRCNATGLWEGSLPDCIVDCGLLDQPNNLTMIHYEDNSTLVDSTAVYSCLPGYILPNNDSRVCLDRGIWSDPEPVCQPVDCGFLPSPANGLVRHSLTTTLASPARYSCNIGFRLIGNEFRICLEDGTWSGTPPTCQIIDCGSLESPENGRVQFNSTIFTSQALYSCDPGYMIAEGGDELRFCRIDGTWGGEAPTCQLIDCGGLSAPANGFVQVSSTAHGGTADYSCVTGYVLQGPQTRTCGNNGKWSGEEPTCQLVDCGDPGILINGQRVLFGTTYRQVVTFICNSDFTMVGDGARRCEANGMWTGDIPRCIANVPTCEILDPPDNGYIILEATVPGSQVKYGCNEGFELIGSDTRSCETNQQWTGSAPECRRITRCPSLVTPNFSRRIGDSNEIGSVVYFICEDDYDTIGSNARLCQEDRKWSGVQTSCVLRNTSCNVNGTVRDPRGRQCQCVDGELSNCCRQRQDWLSLSTAERTRYAQAVIKASSDNLYKPLYQSLMQRYHDGSGTIALRLNPEGTQFLPWHRHYLQQYEDLLRLVDPGLVLPYWDWTLFSSNPYANPIFSPQDGFGNSSNDTNFCMQNGPYRRGEFSLTSVSGGGCLERQHNQGILLTRDQLDDPILAQPADQFSRFFNFLTVPYVTIRCTVGGTMCALNEATPTEDPLHILVLSFLDSIWDRWQQKSISHKLARYSSDQTPLYKAEDFSASDYHDNSNLPNEVSVCYTDPVDIVSSGGMRKREAEEITCVSEDWMDRLSMAGDERSAVRAACRLLYTYFRQ